MGVKKCHEMAWMAKKWNEMAKKITDQKCVYWDVYTKHCQIVIKNGRKEQ